MPDDLVKAANSAKTDADLHEVGVEWTIHQCRELVEMGVPCLHFYTMGDGKTIQRIIKGIS